MLARWPGGVHPAAVDLARRWRARRSPRRCSRPAPTRGRASGSRCGGCGRPSSSRRATCGRRSARSPCWPCGARRRGAAWAFSRSRGRPWRARSRLCRHSTAARTSSRFARVGMRLVLAQPSCELVASGRACAAAGTQSAASASTIARPGPLRGAVERNTNSLPVRQWIRIGSADPKPLSVPSATRLTRRCEPRGFASRPRGRFALSGGEPGRCIGYGALDLSARRGAWTDGRAGATRNFSRGDRIRTGDLPSPKRMRYQAALRPERRSLEPRLAQLVTQRPSRSGH